MFLLGPEVINCRSDWIMFVCPVVVLSRNQCCTVFIEKRMLGLSNAVLVVSKSALIEEIDES